MCESKKLYLYYDDFAGKMDAHYIKYIADRDISVRHKEGSHLLPRCIEFEMRDIPGFATIWVKVENK